MKQQDSPPHTCQDSCQNRLTQTAHRGRIG
jgi:hypothetical protein